MAQYTTATLVKKRIENIDTSLTDGDIDAFIEDAEQILNAIMGANFLTGGTPGGFSATKHGILRAAANAWAAIAAIGFNPVGFSSLAEAQVIMEILVFQWEFCVDQLRDKSVVSFLESL